MIRYILGIPVAATITLALFFLMEYLVTGDYELKEDDTKVVEISITRDKRDETLNLDERDIKRPEEAKPPPPPPPASAPRKPPRDTNIDIDLSQFGDVDINAGSGFRSDSDVQPIVRVPPQYPVRATERGIEGWVLVEFTVTETGSVKDPVVLDAEPPNIFNRAATRSVVKWKYKPQMVAGKATEWREKVVLTFVLDDDGR